MLKVSLYPFFSFFFLAIGTVSQRCHFISLFYSGAGSWSTACSYRIRLWSAIRSPKIMALTWHTPSHSFTLQEKERYLKFTASWTKDKSDGEKKIKADGTDKDKDMIRLPLKGFHKYFTDLSSFHSTGLDIQEEQYCTHLYSLWHGNRNVNQIMDGWISVLISNEKL